MIAAVRTPATTWSGQQAAVKTGRARRVSRGFSLVEAVMVLAVGMILTAVAVPLVQSAVRTYRFRTAVSNVSWAIQATRYRAIMSGYPFAITFNSANNTYQVASQPPGAAGFTNVGRAIPLQGANVTLSQDTTLQFRPNGLVQATTGAKSLTLSYGEKSKTISVSSFGNVTVYP